VCAAQGWGVFQTMLVRSVSHIAPEQVRGGVMRSQNAAQWDSVAA
jgi:hypothetical protein